MEKIGSCKYNPHIMCERQVCGTCGWNPDIEKKRKSKLKRHSPIENTKWIVGEKKNKQKDVNTFEEE